MESLNALLDEVDRHVGVETSTSYGIGVMDRLKARAALATDAPRLAAIVRVAVAALGKAQREMPRPEVVPAVLNAWTTIDAALARIEALANGEARHAPVPALDRPATGPTPTRSPRRSSATSSRTRSPRRSGSSRCAGPRRS